jgi:hypothetical protein
VGALENLLLLNNLDTDGEVVNAITILSDTGFISNVIDMSDLQITNAFVTAAGTISIAELNILQDGAISASEAAADMATQAEIDAQDECSEITNCVPSAIIATDVTYENLSTNSDIGFGAAQVPQGSLAAPLADPTFTGTVTVPTPFTIGAVSMTSTGTELNLLDGITVLSGDNTGDEVSAASGTLGVIELDTDLGGTAAAPTVVNVQAGAVPNGGIVAATVGAVELETAFETVNKCWEFDYDTDSITTSDEYTFTTWPTATTVTRIDCESWSGTSFTISVCKGEDRGDDSCTTDMLSPATLACTTTRSVDSSPANTALTARQPVTIVVTAVSGTVTAGEICLEATID